MPAPLDLRQFCRTAREFWRTNVLPPGERVILVEAFSQDLRVTVRNLTVANALRRFEPARLVVMTGIDADWSSIWPQFDQSAITSIAEAYGAELVYDVHELVDRRLEGSAEPLVVDGVDLAGDLPEPGIAAEAFDRIVNATACRMDRVARFGDSADERAYLARVAARSREFARVYDAQLGGLDVLALVTSHVDYNNFGLAVESALRHQVPVLFPQSTGGLKCYGLFPEHQDLAREVRADLTERIGRFFEEHLWANRELLDHGRDVVQYRMKHSLGLPAWWRGLGVHSQLQLDSEAARTAVRAPASELVGLDPAKPIVGVFNHAVSDALGTNVEAFADLAAWYEETAAFAAEHDEVGWLFLDHPHQEQYDRQGFFAGLRERYADRPHLVFLPSMDLPKTYLVALVDLVVTLRGSVSNEYPAFGIPAVQAGWSEWSSCGFTSVATTAPEYFALLQRQIDGLLRGEELITPEQVERARLWAWFYRSATDVSSAYVQNFALGEGAELFAALDLTMRQVESDADPAFTAVRRMWKRRDPFLTRIDWCRERAELAEELAGVGR